MLLLLLLMLLLLLLLLLLIWHHWEISFGYISGKDIDEKWFVVVVVDDVAEQSGEGVNCVIDQPDSSDIWPLLLNPRWWIEHLCQMWQSWFIHRITEKLDTCSTISYKNNNVETNWVCYEIRLTKRHDYFQVFLYTFEASRFMRQLEQFQKLALV